MSPSKMALMQTSLSSVEKNILGIGDDNPRLFNFKLDLKATKSKLLKGAKRIPFEVIPRQKCINLDFSDGAFKLTVMVLLNIWFNCFKDGEIFKFKDREMKILELKQGFDEDNKHVDTKIVMVDGPHKLTLHVYNSTQKINVAGKGHDSFVKEVLVPYFSNQVASLKNDIAQYNKKVIETLSSNVPKVKRSDVKFKALSGSLSSCNKCNFSCKSKIQLIKHKSNVHSNSFNIRTRNQSTTEELEGPKHSTRENSMSEVMNEDISIAAIETEVLIEDISVAAIEREKTEDNIPLIENENTAEPNDVNVSKTDYSKKEESMNIGKTEDSKSEDTILRNEGTSKVQNTLVEEIIEETVDKAVNNDGEGIVFKCDVCEVSFPKIEILNTHIKIHLNERVVQNSSILNNIDKIYCDVCSFKAKNDEEMLVHIGNGHLKEVSVICGVCAESFDTKQACTTHMEGHHISNLNEDPVLTFPCDECNCMFLKISILKAHKAEIHGTNDLEKTTENVNSDYDYLKRKIDSSLKILNENIDSSINSLNEKFDSSLDMLHIIVNKQSEIILQLEEKVKTLSSQVKQQTNNSKGQQQHPVLNQQGGSNHHIGPTRQEAPVQQHVPTQQGPPSQHIPPQHGASSQESASKAKMLIVGTSLNRKLHQQVIKNVTDCDVTFKEAFTVDHDENAFYPDKNFFKVVPQELQKEDFSVLVLSCGPNEISNLDTTLNYRENIDEWRNKVGQSSVKMFQLAEWCLQKYSSLKSVVIVKRPPRYDNRIKAHLSEYANAILDEMMKKSGNKNICVSRQKLSCDGYVRMQRFGNPSYNNYDGIHMRGKLAVQHMTMTFINMMVDIYPHLKPANLSESGNF